MVDKTANMLSDNKRDRIVCFEASVVEFASVVDKAEEAGLKVVLPEYMA